VPRSITNHFSGKMVKRARKLVLDVNCEVKLLSKENRVVEHLVKQFESCWNILRQSIMNVPDEKWAIGIEKIDKPWNQTKGENVWYFSERVYHIIETVEFYMADTPESMKEGSRIGGIEWRKESPEETAHRIRKDDMLEYLEETKESLEKKLRSFSDSDFFETDGFSEWQSTRLAKFLYTMRHSMWHIGELSRSLRNYDCKRTNWQ
jgi:hypothetical protein